MCRSLARMVEVAGLETLQTELEADVAADSRCWADTIFGTVLILPCRYWVRNAAKFRAVSQGVSYEQFTSLVDSSHLSPLARKDLTSLGPKQGLWNSVARETRPGVQQEAGGAGAGVAGAALPRNLHEFQRSWRKLGVRKERVDLLAALGEVGLGKVFAVEVPADILEGIVEALLEDLEKGGEVDLGVLVLRSCTGGRRFSLGLELLGPGGREGITRLLGRLEEEGAGQGELQHLRDLYCVKAHS